MKEAQERFRQIFRLVEKEEEYLKDVAGRLFVVPVITPDWLDRLIDTPEGRDCLEAFVSKFSRMKDTLVDKLLPSFLAGMGEKTGAAIDNLNRAERLGLLANSDQWLSMRQLRNRLVHEHVEDRKELAAALTVARSMTDALLGACRDLHDSAQSRFSHGRGE